MFKLFELEYYGTTHFDEHVKKMYTTRIGRFLTCSHLGTGADVCLNVVSLNKNNYWKIEKLFEWHFDVFGLIEKGLAINVNDL